MECRFKKCSTAWRIHAWEVPLRQPIPRWTMRGKSSRVLAKGETFRISMQMPRGQSGFCKSPAGRFPAGNGKADAIPTGCPGQQCGGNFLGQAHVDRVQPCWTAQLSTENTSRTSVAVVTTGMAPTASATPAASRLACPIWPDNREMENRPASSTATTAGSTVFPRRQGAMAPPRQSRTRR